MIYLIKTSYYDEKTCKPMFLLKIGYAKDIDGRIKTYKTHNPLVQLLDTRDGDYELENYLHVYFSEYAYPNQPEWFYYNERIIQDFKTVEIKPLLSDILVCIKKLFTTSVSFMRLKERYIKKYGESEFNKSKEFIFNAWLEYSKWMNSIELVINGNTNNLEYNTIIQVNNIPFDIKTIKFSINQILGRQRLIENPWKNSADLYVTLKYEGEKSKKEYQEYMAKKENATNDLLSLYSKGTDNEKGSLAIKYEKDARNSNYKDDYVAVNHHSGSSMLPVFNKLMQVAEMRTFEIQEYDYADRVSVLSRIDENYNISENKDKIDATVNNFKYQYTTFVDKMKYLCGQKENLSEDEYSVVLSLVPMEYSNYITTLGIDLIKSKSYKKGDLDIEFKNLSQNQLVSNALGTKIINEFNVGKRYTKVEIKEKLREIYSSLGYKKTAKATDLDQWFELKSVLINRKVNGFEIIKKKGD